MPHVTVEHGRNDNPVYQVGGKSFVYFRNPRPDAVGPALGIVPAVKLVPEFVRSVSSPSTATPGVVHVDLRPGRYVVFELTGHESGVGGGGINFSYTTNNAPSIGPEAVSVTSSTT